MSNKANGGSAQELLEHRRRPKGAGKLVSPVPATVTDGEQIEPRTPTHGAGLPLESTGNGTSLALAPATEASTSLAEHAAEIRRLGKCVVGDVIEIGRRLTECQEIVGHGNCLPWLDRELGCSQSAALNFMRAFQLAKSKSANFADLNLPISALYLLAAPSTPAAARDEILERTKAGEDIKVADVKKAIAAAKQSRPLKSANSAAAPKAMPRATHLDVIAAWIEAAPAERTKAIDGIGLLPLLDAMPDAWWPPLKKHVAERRPVNASAVAPSEPGSDDLSNYEYLGREPGNSTEIVSGPPEGENYDDLDEVEEERPRRKIKQVEHSCGIDRAIDMARWNLLDLASDYHDIVDSVHDNLRGTERIQRLVSLACKIEKFAQLKVPAALSKLPVKFTLPKRRPWASSTAQAFDAVTILQACAMVLEGIVDGDQGHADAQVLSADLRSVMDAIKY